MYYYIHGFVCIGACLWYHTNLKEEETEVQNYLWIKQTKNIGSKGHEGWNREASRRNLSSWSLTCQGRCLASHTLVQTGKM